MCLSAAASGIFRLNDGVDHCHGGSFPGTMPTIKIRCYTSTSALGNHTVQAKSVWEIHTEIHTVWSQRRSTIMLPCLHMSFLTYPLKADWMLTTVTDVTLLIQCQGGHHVFILDGSPSINTRPQGDFLSLVCSRRHCVIRKGHHKLAWLKHIILSSVIFFNEIFNDFWFC